MEHNAIFNFIDSYEVKMLCKDAHDAQMENVASRLCVSARVRKRTLYNIKNIYHLVLSGEWCSPD